ncbi:hypothetical protein PsYK624_017610 [Phanerochaete sordida]|uniref:Store-operated calcium entry-associated regulatory factor n=1 Tax=Phanerochaete sordida TaxID=48140 RepID=A0A9P3G054_9APHY|nr:hypothetical protein PsYK624_017610 [Phanerochaete sordida]
MSRVRLDKIKSLTFYQDALTAARRTDPLPQLTCIGKACRLFTPEAVRCVNIGGEGTEVDWKCEADLPEALRFGRVQVSCEGYDRPGDPYVLKGSCALEYRLVEVPNALRGEEAHKSPSRLWSWFGGRDPIAILFTLVWIAVFAYILWHFLKPCFGRQRTDTPRRPDTGPSRPSYGGGSRPWDHSPRRPSDHTDPPPPYTKYPNRPRTSHDVPPAAPSAVPDWRPGFWTGAALGGLGTYLMNQNTPRRDAPTATAYDWERARAPRASPVVAAPGFGGSPRARRGFFSSDDRGEGSSSGAGAGLGSMRRSSGFGGSSVR